MPMAASSTRTARPIHGPDPWSCRCFSCRSDCQASSIALAWRCFGGIEMPELLLHHVSLVVTDLERALAFYRDVIGLPQIPRPAIPVPGIWMGCGDRQIHLILYTPGTFRDSPRIDIADAHFAFRTDDF